MRQTGREKICLINAEGSESQPYCVLISFALPNSGALLSEINHQSMGTRGLFGIRKKGQRKASHNNYDSNDLALEFTRFLVQISPAELVRLAKLVDELIWVDSDSPLEPTSTIETYEHYGYEIFSSSSRGRYCRDDMRYAIQGVRSLYEILD